MTITAIVAVITAQVLFAQTQQPLKPTVPGTPGDPAWQSTFRLTDGRTFVTDGGLAIDAALVNTTTLPERQVAAKVVEGYLNAAHNDEYTFSDLKAAASGKTYTTPNGIPVSATYINYLRRMLPARSVRFRMTTATQPVVIVQSGKVVGVLMPVAQ